jgi:lipid-A-disaccharide synthase
MAYGHARMTEKWNMTKHIYIIAGEASGDVIGGQLMAALKARAPELSFSGIGGTAMQKQGLHSLFDMHQLALMGFAEVLPHLPRLKKRIAETVADILAKQPDIIITIDSPGFNFRIAKALKKAGYPAPRVHYVAPTVWAYKPKRAAKTAALFDALLCILPFEPPYFTKHGLKASFVGHPVAWLHREHGDGAAFRREHHITTDTVLLGMMPGSRKGELARHLPIFRETVVKLRLKIPESAAHVKARVLDWPVPVTLVSGPNAKRNAFAACNMALAKSGTVALETALAGIPTITTFRANRISAALVKRLINIPYVNLMNIMAYFGHDPAPIPELLQQHCNPKALSNVLLKFWHSPSAQHAQKEACAKYVEQLGMNEKESPSEKAAAEILTYIENPNAN